MNLINPKRFFVKGVESQGEANQEAKKKGKNFFPFHSSNHRPGLFPFQ
jgi:hypothetical protein